MGISDIVASAAAAAQPVKKKKTPEELAAEQAKRDAVTSKAGSAPNIKWGGGSGSVMTGVPDIDKFMGASKEIFKDYGKKIDAAPRASQVTAESLAVKQAKDAGKISQDTQGLLNIANTQAQTANQISPEQLQVIAARQAGLSGFNAEENTAMREAMLQNIARSEQGALRQLRGAQAGAGIRGGLAGAQSGSILNQMANERAAGERDLFIKNIAQKDAALGAFENSARGIQGEAFTRGQQALGTALSGQTGAENQAFSQGQQAVGSLAQIGGGIQGQTMAGQQFNVGQGDKKIEQQLATALGMSGLENTKEFQAMMAEFYKNGTIPGFAAGSGAGGSLPNADSGSLGISNYLLSGE